MSPPSDPDHDLLRRIVSVIKTEKRARRRAMRRAAGPWADFLLAMEQIHLAAAPALPGAEAGSENAKVPEWNCCSAQEIRR
jgi:hypothetical protein